MIFKKLQSGCFEVKLSCKSQKSFTICLFCPDHEWSVVVSVAFSCTVISVWRETSEGWGGDRATVFWWSPNQKMKSMQTALCVSVCVCITDLKLRLCHVSRSLKIHSVMKVSLDFEQFWDRYHQRSVWVLWEHVSLMWQWTFLYVPNHQRRHSKYEKLSF